MPIGPVTLIPLRGIKMVEAGDDLAAIAAAAIAANEIAPQADDVLVVAQKVVSKAEGRLVAVAAAQPSERAISLAAEVDKDPRFVETVLSESRRVVRHRPGLLIVEHLLGFVMANAGIDHSNVAADDGVERVLLLPVDPDASAEGLREHLGRAFGVSYRRCRSATALAGRGARVRSASRSAPPGCRRSSTSAGIPTCSAANCWSRRSALPTRSPPPPGC